jgi:hypothetical protein
VQWVVVAAEPVTDVDTTAADALKELLDDLAAAGIVLGFAEMKDPVKDQLGRYGLFTDVGANRFFPTIGTAVHGYVEETGVEWVDWEDARATPSESERASPRVPMDGRSGGAERTDIP